MFRNGIPFSAIKAGCCSNDYRPCQPSHPVVAAARQSHFDCGARAQGRPLALGLPPPGEAARGCRHHSRLRGAAGPASTGPHHGVLRRSLAQFAVAEGVGGIREGRCGTSGIPQPMRVRSLPPFNSHQSVNMQHPAILPFSHDEVIDGGPSTPHPPTMEHPQHTRITIPSNMPSLHIS